MKFREYQSQDFEVLAALHVQVFGDVGETRKAFVALVEDSRYLFWVAEDSEKPVGYIIYSCHGTSVYLNWIAVQSTARKKGIAHQLLAQMEAWAQVHKFETLTLESRNQFKDAMIFYLRNGFEIRGTFLHSDGALMVRFLKSLS